MKSILYNWNIEGTDIIEVQNNVWLIDDKYYLKATRNKNWVRNLEIYKTLEELGIPVPKVIGTNQGKYYYTDNNINYILTDKIEGRHLEKEELLDSKWMAYEVGKVIGRLHKSFSDITDKYEFVDNNFMDELNGWIKDSLEKYAKNIPIVKSIYLLYRAGIGVTDNFFFINFINS